MMPETLGFILQIINYLDKKCLRCHFKSNGLQNIKLLAFTRRTLFWLRTVARYAIEKLKVQNATNFYT